MDLIDETFTQFFKTYFKKKDNNLYKADTPTLEPLEENKNENDSVEEL